MTDKQAAALTWLNRTYAITTKIEALKDEKRCLANDYQGFIKNIGAGRSSKANVVEDRRVKLSSISQQIDRETAKLQKERLKIKQVIESVPEEHYALLSFRYISLLSWQDIEGKLFISTSTRKRRHNAALDSVALVLNRE